MLKPRNLSNPADAEKALVETTTVNKAHTKYSGLRTHIPATYANDLGLQADDKVTWELDKDEKGKFLKIRKA